MALEEIRVGTQGAWDDFYSWRRIWARSRRRRVAEGARRVRADLEAVSPDVREHRHRDRQRARVAIRGSGPVSRASLPPAVPRQADAGPGRCRPSRRRASLRSEIERAGDQLVRAASCLVVVGNRHDHDLVGAILCRHLPSIPALTRSGDADNPPAPRRSKGKDPGSGFRPLTVLVEKPQSRGRRSVPESAGRAGAA